MQKYLYLLLLLILPLHITHAQAEEKQQDNLETKIYTVADVSIDNAVIENREQNSKISIAFDIINNEDKAQPGVTYIIKAYKVNAKGEDRQFADIATFGDTFSLNNKQIVHKTFKYYPPASFNGDYDLDIVVANQSGTILASKTIPFVEIKTNEGATIDPHSCYLTIGDGDKKYSLDQGVDLKQEEKLFLHCDRIKNNLKQEIVFTPAFDTHYHSAFGKKALPITQIGKEQTITPNEERVLTVEIPIQYQPQAYTTLVSLQDGNFITISNTIPVHYVIIGESATINSLTIDKTVYKKGDKAHLEIIVSSSAHNFQGRRIKDAPQDKEREIIIDIADNQNQSCAREFKQKLDNTKSTYFFDIEMDKECVSPIASIEIRTTDGQILVKDEFDTGIVSGEIRQNNQTEKILNWKKIISWGVIIVIAILVFFLLVKLVKNKKIFMSVVLIVIFCVVSQNTFAQNNSDIVDSSVKVIEGNSDDIVANVDFEKVTVEQDKKDNRKMTISFDIVNHHTKVLSNLVNSVQVLKGQRVIYEEVIPGATTIAPQSSVKEVIYFTAPKFIGGNVSLRIMGADRTGLVLEDYIIDNIALPQQDTKGITIHDCSLFVNDKEQFLLSDGVDISPQEKLSIECDVDNNSDQDITYTSEIAVYKKSIYNGKIETTWKGKENVLTKQSTKTVNFEIPHPQLPGYYDTRLNFLNNNDKVATGVVAHFVLQGESASLSFVSFDKQQYKKGDKIIAKVLIAGSADSFPGARSQKSIQPKNMILKGTIESEGKKCAEDIKKDISGEDGAYDIIIEKKATKDCKKPVANISLYDENGQLLDSNEYKLYTETKNVVKDSSKSSSQSDRALSKIVMLIFAILFIIALATWLIYLTRKHHNGSIGLFVLIMTLGVLMGAHSVHAGITVQCGPNSSNNHGYCYYDASPTGDCSTMRGEARISWNVCQNHKRSLEIQWKPTVNNQFESLVKDSEIYIRQCKASGGTGHYHDFGHCKPGTSDQKVNGGSCIKDNGCDKNYYGFYCPDCNNMQDYNDRFRDVGSGMSGYGLKSAQVTKTVGSGNHTARFRFMFRDLKDHKDDVDVYYNAPYIVPTCASPTCTLSFNKSTAKVGESVTLSSSASNATTGDLYCTGPIPADIKNNPGLLHLNNPQDPFTSTGIERCELTVRNDSAKTGKCIAQVIVKKKQDDGDPTCGPADGGEFKTKPSTGLCGPDTTATAVTEESDRFWWNCNGKGGSVGCQAKKIKDNPPPLDTPQCGSADGTSGYSCPTTGLCSVGKLTNKVQNLSSCTWECYTGQYATGNRKTCSSSLTPRESGSCVINLRPQCGPARFRYKFPVHDRDKLCSYGYSYGDKIYKDDSNELLYPRWGCKTSYTTNCGSTYYPLFNSTVNDESLKNFAGCGKAQALTYETRPPDDQLCWDGKVKWIDQDASDGTWDWECEYTNNTLYLYSHMGSGDQGRFNRGSASYEDVDRFCSIYNKNIYDVAPKFVNGFMWSDDNEQIVDIRKGSTEIPFFVSGQRGGGYMWWACEKPEKRYYKICNSITGWCDDDYDNMCEGKQDGDKPNGYGSSFLVCKVDRVISNNPTRTSQCFAKKKGYADCGAINGKIVDFDDNVKNCMLVANGNYRCNQSVGYDTLKNNDELLCVGDDAPGVDSNNYFGSNRQTRFDNRKGMYYWQCGSQQCHAFDKQICGSQCGSANGKVLDTKPLQPSELCNGVSDYSGIYWIDVQAIDGTWNWECQVGQSPAVQCNANKQDTDCLDDPLTYTNPVMLSNNMTSNVSIKCQNVCCAIHSTTHSNDEVPEITVCNGAPGQVKILEGGNNNFQAMCWIDSNDNHIKDDAEKNANKDFIVQTVCMNAHCSTNGICTKMMQPANNRAQCASTCNSDSDCTKGRIIETRP